MPRADVTTPNQFEVARLVGEELRTTAALVAAARSVCARSIVTGCTLCDTPEGMVDTVAVERGPGAARREAVRIAADLAE